MSNVSALTRSIVTGQQALNIHPIPMESNNLRAESRSEKLKHSHHLITSPRRETEHCLVLRRLRLSFFNHKSTAFHIRIR